MSVVFFVLGGLISSSGLFEYLLFFSKFKCNLRVLWVRICLIKFWDEDMVVLLLVRLRFLMWE